MLFTACNQVAHVLLRSLPKLESPPRCPWAALRSSGEAGLFQLRGTLEEALFASLSVLGLLDGWLVVVEVT